MGKYRVSTKHLVRRHAFSAIATIFLLLLLILLSDRHDAARPAEVGYGPQLLALVESAMRNGGPLVTVDLTSGTTTVLHFNAMGCDGAAKDNASKKVRVLCRFGAESAALLDPSSGELTFSPAHEGGSMSFRVPLACGEHECYFATGAVSQTGDSSAKLFVMDGARVVAHDLPNRKRDQVPMRLALSSGKLWILTRGATGDPAEIIAFDPEKGRFDERAVRIGADAWDIAVGDTTLAVSVFRPVAGADVVIYDKDMLRELKRITVQGDVGNSFNAFGVAVRGDRLYVAGSDGVSMYDLSTYDLIMHRATDSFAYEAAFGNGYFYVALPALDRIIEVDPETIETKRTFPVKIGTGRLVVISGEGG